jgi:hypothetical protein
MDTQLDKCCIITLYYILLYLLYLLFYCIILVLVSCIVLHFDLYHIYFMLSDGFYIHVYGFMEGTIK